MDATIILKWLCPPPAHPSTHPSIHPSISIHPAFRLSVRSFPSVHLLIRPPDRIHPFVTHPSIHHSIHLEQAGPNLASSQIVNCGVSCAGPWIFVFQGGPAFFRGGGSNFFQRGGGGGPIAYSLCPPLWIRTCFMCSKRLGRTYTYHPPIYHTLPCPVFLTRVRVDLG